MAPFFSQPVKAGTNRRAQSPAQKRKSNTLLLTQLGVFTAVEIIFCFTVLGSLPISPGIVATLSHIPPLIVAIYLGRWPGAYMGGVMGVCALIIWTVMPPNPATAFAFSPLAPNGNWVSLVICLVPRVLFPYVAGVLYPLLAKRMARPLSAVIAAVVGTVCHSALVLGLIYLTFHQQPVVGGNFLTFILAWAGLNACIEIVLAGLLCGLLICPLDAIRHRLG